MSDLIDYLVGNFQSDIESAISWYNSGISVQDHWPQFHHFCYWELAWANLYTLNWREAYRYEDCTGYF